MRVSNSTDTNAVQNAEASRVKVTRAPRTHGTEKSSAAAESAAAGGSSPAGAEISAKAKEFAKAKEIASHAPDVREEKIAALKARIASGNYKMDASAIADKMVDEHLKTHGMD